MSRTVDQGDDFGDGQGGRSTRSSAKEPDPRFTFANERTYLAWNRTSLALIVGGLAVAQFLKVGAEGTQLIVAVPLIALGGYLSLRSYQQWRSNQRSLQLTQPLPSSALPKVLLYGVAISSVDAIALAALHFAT